MEELLSLLLRELESSRPIKKRKTILLEVESRTAKNKTIERNGDRVALRVRIWKAEGIDHPPLRPFVMNRFYNVVFWVEPGHEFQTDVMEGLPDPAWDHVELITIWNPHDPELFLNLEVLRFNSMDDPGASTGRIVVGRTRIPLPEQFNLEKEGNFTLVRAQGEGFRPEGHIMLTMMLERVGNQD